MILFGFFHHYPEVLAFRFCGEFVAFIHTCAPVDVAEYKTVLSAILFSPLFKFIYFRACNCPSQRSDWGTYTGRLFRHKHSQGWLLASDPFWFFNELPCPKQSFSSLCWWLNFVVHQPLELVSELQGKGALTLFSASALIRLPPKVELLNPTIFRISVNDGFPHSWWQVTGGKIKCLKS